MLVYPQEFAFAQMGCCMHGRAVGKIWVLIICGEGRIAMNAYRDVANSNGICDRLSHAVQLPMDGAQSVISRK